MVSQLASILIFILLLTTGCSSGGTGGISPLKASPSPTPYLTFPPVSPNPSVVPNPTATPAPTANPNPTPQPPTVYNPTLTTDQWDQILSHPCVFHWRIYLAFNPDLYNAGITTQAAALAHFKQYGASEGRVASLIYNVKVYRRFNPDVTGSNLAMIAHFMLSGVSEGRRGSLIFDANQYIRMNPSLYPLYQAFVVQSPQTSYKAYAALHYVTQGAAAGLTAVVTYEPTQYLVFNPDLERGFAGMSASQQQAYGSVYQFIAEHYLIYGIHEERMASLAFQIVHYKFLNSDVVTYYQTLTQGETSFRSFGELATEHFQRSGIHEIRSSSSVFDLAFYARANPDLVQAYNSLSAADRAPYLTVMQFLTEHFLMYGIKEARLSALNYDGKAYAGFNSDLVTGYAGNAGVQTRYGSLYRYVADHYILYGIHEGRASALNFMLAAYLALNPDLNAPAQASAAYWGSAGRFATLHYLKYGVHEGRPTTIAFKANDFIAKNTDLPGAWAAASAATQAAYGSIARWATEHYLLAGINEERYANTTFSVGRYRLLNNDLVTAYNGLTDPQKADYRSSLRWFLTFHFLKYGAAEGRPY